jgi:hypothetical protein
MDKIEAMLLVISIIIEAFLGSYAHIAFIAFCIIII